MTTVSVNGSRSLIAGNLAYILLLASNFSDDAIAAINAMKMENFAAIGETFRCQDVMKRNGNLNG